MFPGVLYTGRDGLDVSGIRDRASLVSFLAAHPGLTFVHGMGVEVYDALAADVAKAGGSIALAPAGSTPHFRMADILGLTKGLAGRGMTGTLLDVNPRTSVQPRATFTLSITGDRDAPQSTSPVGTWRGTSLCLVRPSACNDEVVVYRIAHTTAADSLTVDARKIVRGEEQEMGVLTCRFTSSTGSLTCAMPQGTWRFRVRNDSLVGELRLSNNTKFRDVRTIRAP